MIPNPPYSREEIHPWLPAESPDHDTGYEYCSVCGSGSREYRYHVRDADIDPHEFISWRNTGWRCCACCGYQRVNVKHPSERVLECGFQVNLFPEQGDEHGRITGIVLRCPVDMEQSPKHPHQFSMQGETIDGASVWVRMTW